MIVWSESFMEDVADAIVYCSMSPEDCIAVQRSLGIDEDYIYETDGEALIDFMAVRGAIDTDNVITIGKYDYEAFAS